MYDVFYQSSFVSYVDDIDTLKKWCGDFCLTLNVCETKEMILDFRKGHNHEPVITNGDKVEIVNKFKYRGTIIDNKLTFDESTTAVYKKSMQRFIFSGS